MQNIPETYNQSMVKDYVEGTLDVDVDGVIYFPLIQKRALVILKEELNGQSLPYLNFVNEL